MLVNLTFLNAQNVKGEGPVITEEVKMGEILTLSLGLSANVYLTQGSQQQIEIEGQQNIIDLINKKNEGNSWDIKFLNNSKISNYEKLEVHITVRDIKSLNIGGSGSIIAQNKFNDLGDISMNIGGSGSIKMDLEAKDIKANIGGSGSIKLSGDAAQLNANIGGSGSVKAIELKVGAAKVNTAGSGSVEIEVTDKIDATIVGSGGVKYKGNPKIQKNVMGSGRVRSY